MEETGADLDQGHEDYSTFLIPLVKNRQRARIGDAKLTGFTFLARVYVYVRTIEL